MKIVLAILGVVAAMGYLYVMYGVWKGRIDKLDRALIYVALGYAALNSLIIWTKY